MSPDLPVGTSGFTHLEGLREGRPLGCVQEYARGVCLCVGGVFGGGGMSAPMPTSAASMMHCWRHHLGSALVHGRPHAGV